MSIMQTCKLACQIIPCTIKLSVPNRFSLLVLIRMVELLFLLLRLVLYFCYLKKNSTLVVNNNHNTRYDIFVDIRNIIVQFGKEYKFLPCLDSTMYSWHCKSNNLTTTIPVKPRNNSKFNAIAVNGRIFLPL